MVAPDLSLYVDDFRAGERTFSLLTQVIGRAGRGRKQGRAVIQTFTPDNDVILCSVNQDYDSFYESEIRLRQLRNYPPFSDMTVIIASGPNEESVLRCCTVLRQALETQLDQNEAWTILGPAPASVVKINNRYRYRLTLTGRSTKRTRTLIAQILRAAHRDKNNRGVSVYADVNPYSD